MPKQIVKVPGVGEIEFPAGMSPEDIQRAIETEIAPRQGVGMSALLGFNQALLPQGIRGAIGSPDPRPGTGAERVAASAGRMLGHTVPIAGGMAAMARFLPAAPQAAGLAERTLSSMIQPFRSAPVATNVAEALAAGGAGIGGGIAEEVFPGSPTARIAGELIGGVTPAAAGYAPAGIAARGVGFARSRLSPDAQTMASKEFVARQLRDDMTPQMWRDLERSQDVQIPGFEPSLAERTGAPSLVATQRGIEAKATGPELDALAARYDANIGALRAHERRVAPDDVPPEFIIDPGQRRIESLQTRIADDQATVQARREALADDVPGIARAEAGEQMRQRLLDERTATQQRMTERAQELGINEADVSMAFQPVRDEIQQQFRLVSPLEDPEKIPQAVRILRDIPDDRPLTFQDLRLYRERIGDDLRDAQSAASPNSALIRNLAALRQKVDDVIDDLAQSADPDLAARYQQFRDEYYRDYVTRFERGPAVKVRQKDARGFYRTADEDVAKAFFAPGNVSAARQYKAVFGDENIADIEAVALDSLRAAAVRDGVVDQRAMTRWLRDHASVLDEFPTIRQRVQNIGEANQALLQRNADLTRRQRTIEDSILARDLQAFERGTKTPDQIMDSAIRNPKRMEQLVKSLDDDGKAALRRAVWDRAQRDPQTFIHDNRPMLESVLGPRHVENLEMINWARDMMGRVGRPVGRGVSPEPLQEMERAIGMGPSALASRALHAKAGRLSWKVVGADALGRFVRGRSRAETERLYREALYNPEVASALADYVRLRDTRDAGRRIGLFMFNLGDMGEEGIQGGPIRMAPGRQEALQRALME